jgi:hypothetical protein
MLRYLGPVPPGNGSRDKTATANDDTQTPILALFTGVTSSRSETSGLRCRKSTRIPHVHATREPDKENDSMESNVQTEARAPKRGPTTAVHARPPSRRKMGSKFSAETVSCEYPIRNKGWSGIGWESGIIIALGRSKVNMDPHRKLDLRTAPVTVGKLIKATSDACTVL